MASQSLYRKWRSQTFSDLIGQEATVRTLLNAVREGRLAHAYLFCGPRGTGKTSAARLLAKAINCANPQNGEPCNECLSCQEITTGRSPDVIEIDAASNTGVDNIRDLRENVNLLGAGGHFKVYIVDECFSYGELVTLADGSKVPIGKLVETQWQGEVLSYNEQTGEIEPKPIVRHMRKQTSVPTVRVTFDNNRSIVCTINHKFYTPQGQVCAGHLEVGQFVYTNRERITQRQRAVVMGAALGDGHVSLTGSAMRGRLRLMHGARQKEYLEYKVKLLGDLVQSPLRYHDGAGIYSKVGTYSATTLSRPEIAQIHRELYGNEGRKAITRSYLDQIDELGLALWYLDDGALTTQNHRYQRVSGGMSIYPATRSSFSTHSFTTQEAQEICVWLYERWRIEGGITNTAHGPVVWLTLAGTARLHELIAPYMPPCIESKLLSQYRGRFQAPADKGTASGLAVSFVRSIELVPMPEYVYNIEVADNHNYFVRDMLVANCHMLTVSAFNALLKTLEEPPPHVIFVLATTEAHKVLPTIVSRCQRFDFRRFTVRTIVARLRQVAEGEGLTLEPAAADLLARAAQGGMRDALSLLDQAIAYCGAHVDLERARAMLGLADPGAVRNLIVAVAEDRAADALHQLNELVVTGADLRQLQQQLGEEWRALLLARAGADVAEVMDRTSDEARELVSLAGRFSLEELMTCARVFARSETPARGLPTPQLAIELALLECLTIRRHGGVAPQLGAPTHPASIRPAAAAPAPAAHVAAPSQSPQRSEPVPSTPTTPLPTSSAPRADELDLLDLDAGARELDAQPSPAASQAPAAPIAAPIAMPAQPSHADDPSHHPEEAPVTAEAPESEPRSTPMAAGASEMDWLAAAQRDWAMIKKVCKQQSPSTAALLSHASPVRGEAGNPPLLIVEAQFEFHFEKLNGQKAREAVEWALEQVLGARIRARFTLANKDSAGKGAGMNGARSPAPHPGNSENARPESMARPHSPTGAGAPSASAAATPGAALNGHARQEHSRQERPQPGQHNGHTGAPAAPATANGRKPSPAQVEDEAQADAIVREIQRELGAQLLDVRPVDNEREPE